MSFPLPAQSKKKEVPFPVHFMRGVGDHRVGKDDITQIPKRNRTNNTEIKNGSSIHSRATTLEKQVLSLPPDKQRQKHGQEEVTRDLASS